MTPIIEEYGIFILSCIGIILLLGVFYTLNIDLSTFFSKLLTDIFG